MKKWSTEIIAEEPISGILKRWSGPHAFGINIQDAKDYCNANGFGYCRVVGELISDIPCKYGTLNPDFDNAIDYDNTQNN